MPRIACLLVPDFPIAAACRVDPDLAERPLVLAETSVPHARVLAASRAARAAGVRAGHTLAQARSVAGGLTVRRRDPAAEASAPLPLACLTPDAAIVATLERWGVRRLGDLARLPLAEVATRLGAAGAALVRTARGEDERPLAPQARTSRVDEVMG